MKAIGYIRVSTAMQVNDGVSLDAQRAKIRAWADVNDAEVIKVYADEGISGSRGDRPGLIQALDHATESGAALVVYSLSRLSRSTKDTLAIAERLDLAGADLVSISEKIDTTTAAGKMIFRMLAAMAEFERDQLRERIQSSMDYKKSQDCRVGSIPYGFKMADDGVHLDKEPEEQAVIMEARELKAAGMSLRGIAVELENRGLLTRAGKRFHPTQISRMVADG
jgi:DNA invertase Pin-like site-specific DNA recombinase